MTVVVEGHMRIQFFKPDGAEGKLVPDGIPVDLVAVCMYYVFICICMHINVYMFTYARRNS